MMGSEENYDLFDNHEEIVANLGKSGYTQYQNTILPVFNSNAEGFREGVSGVTNINNLSRHILMQMKKSPIMQTRFAELTPLVVNGVESTNFAFKKDGSDQPIMFVDDDRLVFELTINAATNQHTSSDETISPIEPRVYKIILQAVASDAGYENRHMYLENETPDTAGADSYYDTWNN